MRYNNINKVILFGGSLTLLGTIKYLKNENMNTLVYTSPRHASEILDESGTTINNELRELGVPFIVTDDINTENALLDEITPETLGIGFGEAWSFDKNIVNKFNGKLLDYMAIPLPRYRGGAHFTWMILRNDRQGSCNLQLVNTETIQGVYDSGEILKNKKYVFPEGINPKYYFDVEVREGVAFIAEFLDEIKSGKEFSLTKLNEDESLYLPRLNTLKNGWIDWAWSGEEISRFIRAFDTPYKGASTRVDGTRVFLKGAELDTKEKQFHPFQSGIITRITEKEGVVTATRSGHLKIKNVLNGNGELINSSLHTGLRFYTKPDDIQKAMEFKSEYGTKGLVTSNNQDAKQEYFLNGEHICLRPITLDDCTERYVEWLNNPEVNQYLETRWEKQTKETVVKFVSNMINSQDTYLFSIIENQSRMHIGNIKLGPVNPHHSCAYVSYFIGEQSMCGKGYATEAVKLITEFGFRKLGLYRIEAGIYANLIASKRVLEKAGYICEGTLRNQLKTNEGSREDHLLYGLINEDWEKISTYQSLL
jgi:RimJ/RimL family protein N-acetyltransferase/methionyl-tRNA formyltransferase